MPLTAEEITKQPEADLLINFIIDRRRKGLYSLVLFHGLPGTGKSSSGFRIRELLTEKYAGEIVKFRIIKSEKDLAKFALEANEREVWIALVEELSVLFPARRSMSGSNVDAMMILDTCRKKKVILLANAPLWTSVDSHIRLMANVYVEALQIMKAAKIVISKFFRLQTNVMLGKTYFHPFERNGCEVVLMYTRMPNLNEWATYELEKEEAMNKLYDKIVRKAEKREEKEAKELGILPQRKVKPLSEKELKVYSLREKDKLKFREIADMVGMKIPNVHQLYKKVLEKMNFTKEFNKINNKIQPSSPLHKIIEPTREEGADGD